MNFLKTTKKDKKNLTQNLIKLLSYMLKNKTNESLKVRYNATVLKKLGGIKMTNAQLKSGISGTYMHVCHTSMTHKLHACAKHL